MINDIILKQPKELQTKCRVSDTGVFIPATLRQKEILGDIKPGLEEAGNTIEKALYHSVEQPKLRMKSITELLANKGR